VFIVHQNLTTTGDAEVEGTIGVKEQINSFNKR
jgi:hypothetical protein